MHRTITEAPQTSKKQNIKSFQNVANFSLAFQSNSSEGRGRYMPSLRILFEDSDLIAVDKPAGFYVHPPEDRQILCPPHLSCLHILRDQIQCYLYPVHRLDRATSGVLIFAKRKEVAAHLAEQFRNHLVRKTYLAVTRGYCLEVGSINHPLKRETTDTHAIAITHYDRIATFEIAEPNRRHATSRYSLVRVQPITGQKHQIRRHFAHISHPLIGDSTYGDLEHNRIFRDKLSIAGLLLRAAALECIHPTTLQALKLRAFHRAPWHNVFDLFQVCSWISPAADH